MPGLVPGWTVYPKHLLYQIYDVTQMLKDDNIIEAVLGAGMVQRDCRLLWKKTSLRQSYSISCHDEADI